MKKTYKTKRNSILFGVCSGMAEPSGQNPWDVRILFIMLTVLGGIGIPAYLFAALAFPEK